jgi:hypothetical protein
VTIARYTSESFVVTDAGIATLFPRRDSEVWGVIWEISDVAQIGLDLCLGVPGERERFGSFARGVNGEMIATEYYGLRNNQKRGFASPDYLDRIIGAGRMHGLPASYLEELRRWQMKLPKIGGRLSLRGPLSSRNIRPTGLQWRRLRPRLHPV